ncbi:MAG: PLD nuclease N-terminal domain-containing protein [Eggerthellaceae bacterium]|nr:PLD nuclease N-terminal domain-containing protein [Eggerthellaceae bacterium]
MSAYSELLPYLVFLVPVMLIELGLMVAALIHILRHNTYKMGNRVIWVLVSIFISIIGPVLYFILGRADE